MACHKICTVRIHLLLDKRGQHHGILSCQAVAHLMACQNVTAVRNELRLDQQDQHRKPLGDLISAHLMACQGVCTIPVNKVLDQRDQHYETRSCQAVPHLLACQNVIAARVELLLYERDQERDVLHEAHVGGPYWQGAAAGQEQRRDQRGDLQGRRRGGGGKTVWRSHVSPCGSNMEDALMSAALGNLLACVKANSRAEAHGAAGLADVQEQTAWA